MRVISDNILVKELKDNFFIEGVLTVYDADSPYMFARIVDLSKEAKETLEIENEEDTVLELKRYAKEPTPGDMYYVSYKDVRALYSLKEYQERVEVC